MTSNTYSYSENLRERVAILEELRRRAVHRKLCDYVFNAPITETELRANRKCAVYRHVDAFDEVIYVGSSFNPDNRLRDHMRTSPWAHEIASVEMVWHDTGRAAREAECDEIAKRKPKYNRRVRGGSKPALIDVEDMVTRISVQVER